MPDLSHNQPSDPHELLALARSKIFAELAKRARNGTFYPSKGSDPAEYVGVLPELGRMATFSTGAAEIDNPQDIHVSRCRPEIGRYVELWLTPASIDTQHGTWDSESNPHTIDDRQPIHPEELLELYSLLLPPSN